MSNQIQTAFAMKYKKKAINKDYNGNQNRKEYLKAIRIDGKTVYSIMEIE